MVDERTGGRTNERTDGKRMDGRDVRKDGQTDGRDVRTDGCTGGRVVAFRLTVPSRQRTDAPCSDRIADAGRAGLAVTSARPFRLV